MRWGVLLATNIPSADSNELGVESLLYILSVQVLCDLILHAYIYSLGISLEIIQHNHNQILSIDIYERIQQKKEKELIGAISSPPDEEQWSWTVRALMVYTHLR